MALAVSISQKVLIKLTLEYLIIKHVRLSFSPKILTVCLVNLDFRKRNSYEKREKNGNYLVKLKHFFLSPVSYQNFSPVLLFHTVCLLDTREYLEAICWTLFLGKRSMYVFALGKVQNEWDSCRMEKKSIITFCTQNIKVHPNQKD